MSQPTNGEGNSGDRAGGQHPQGGSLGAGWEADQQQSDAPFDAQASDDGETRAFPAVQDPSGQQGSSGHDSQGAHGASPAYGSEAADVAGSATSGTSPEQGQGGQTYSEAQGYGQQPQYGQTQQRRSGRIRPAGVLHRTQRQRAHRVFGRVGPRLGPAAARSAGWFLRAAVQSVRPAGGLRAAEPARWAEPAGWAGSAGQQGQPGAAQQLQGQVGQVIGGAGDGVGALFSDLQFKKSLTERIASLFFLVTIVWAVLHFLANQVYNFGSEDFGSTSVKHMGTGSALVHLLADLVWLVLVVGGARIVLELAVNVARIAQRDRK